MSSKIEIFESKGKFYFRICSKTGRVLITSKPYSSNNGLYKAIESIKYILVSEPEIVTLKEGDHLPDSEIIDKLDVIKNLLEGDDVFTRNLIQWMADRRSNPCQVYRGQADLCNKLGISRADNRAYLLGEIEYLLEIAELSIQNRDYAAKKIPKKHF